MKRRTSRLLRPSISQLERYADPDQRRFEMKVWCRENCACLYAKRFTESPDAVQFDFEDEEDAMMFALRWA